MTNDPRFAGGGHEYGYASTQEAYEPHPAPAPYEPQPMARPAPQGFQPRPATPQPHALSQHATPYVPPQAPMPVVHAPLAHKAPAPAAATASDDENLVILTRPYQAHDELVDRIRLRRPITRDIKQCGNPLKVVTAPDGTIEDLEMKWDVVAKYVTLLASPPMPPSTVDQFDFFDLDACAAVIARFFVRLAQ